MKNYIKEHIGTELSDYRDYNYKDRGIWGYNVVTGNPIYNNQLNDIDSQKF